jgi:hypothetical protein
VLHKSHYVRQLDRDDLNCLHRNAAYGADSIHLLLYKQKMIFPTAGKSVCRMVEDFGYAFLSRNSCAEPQRWMSSQNKDHCHATEGLSDQAYICVLCSTTDQAVP